MNITTEGIGRVKIHEFQMVASGKLYPSSAIERLEDDENESFSSLKLEVFEMLKELHGLLEVEEKVPKNPLKMHSFDIGHHVGMNLQQEYELLTFGSEKERLLAIKKHLMKTLPVVIETERLKSRAKLNGHFKNLIPPRF